jgi:hypothetical protein
MNVEIGAEAAQFPDKEYINGIAFAVQTLRFFFKVSLHTFPVGSFQLESCSF